MTILFFVLQEKERRGRHFQIFPVRPPSNQLRKTKRRASLSSLYVNPHISSEFRKSTPNKCSIDFFFFFFALVVNFSFHIDTPKSAQNFTFINGSISIFWKKINGKLWKGRPLFLYSCEFYFFKKKYPH